jgi:hypothetical protein
VRIRPPLPALSALLLVVAGGLAIGGSFGTLTTEIERAGATTLTLTYTSWRLSQGGSYSGALYFHAPRFGIPLVVAGALTIAAGVLLVLRRHRVVVAGATAVAGLLVGTVWAVSLVVSADLDAVTSNQGFRLTWSTGAGFWLVLAAGAAALLGGVATLATLLVRQPPPDSG